MRKEVGKNVRGSVGGSREGRCVRSVARCGEGEGKCWERCDGRCGVREGRCVDCA